MKAAADIDPLDYFVSTPIGVMHAENHRRLVAAANKSRMALVLLEPAVRVDPDILYVESRFEP